MTPILILVLISLLLIAISHWMGYWYGRTRALYDLAKRWGKIPEDMTWEEFLNMSHTN